MINDNPNSFKGNSHLLTDHCFNFEHRHLLRIVAPDFGGAVGGPVVESNRLRHITFKRNFNLILFNFY